ncbi:Uncharacterised protein [Mycolicibacterium chitae]|uniref:Uncharacterized protein n=1 Tax=Mycolicibacterium chitae TaxID=1792 RepID=A0A3S5EIJ3_MYCCI|nr:Uncharacterised protein [Mycolicibacterium chitae]
MPLSEAAEILGVTPRQAQRLAAGGELGYVRLVGRTAVVKSAAVHRAKNNGTTSKGRPAFPATAWMALALLSGRVPDGRNEMRIADRLAAMTPIEVARFARRRATVRSLRLTVRMAPDTLVAHLQNKGMKPTGLMSPLAVEWGLAADNAAQIDGYLYVGPNRTLRDLKLREDPGGGQISLRLLDFPVDPLPDAAVALDLMESMDSRARSVGRDRLVEMIGLLR